MKTAVCCIVNFRLLKRRLQRLNDVTSFSISTTPYSRPFLSKALIILGLYFQIFLFTEFT